MLYHIFTLSSIILGFFLFKHSTYISINNNMKFQELMEQYGMIKQEKRLFYPRNFNLSEGFIKALKAEIALQEKSGIDADKFAHKLNRALQFHISEHKKNPSPSKGFDS